MRNPGVCLLASTLLAATVACSGSSSKPAPVSARGDAAATDAAPTPAPAGRIYFLGSGGAAYGDATGYHRLAVPSGATITSLVVRRDGTAWLGTADGVYLHDGRDVRALPPVDPVPTPLLEGGDGSLWAIHGVDLARRFDGTAWESVDQAPRSRASCATTDGVVFTAIDRVFQARGRELRHVEAARMTLLRACATARGEVVVTAKNAAGSPEGEALALRLDGDQLTVLGRFDLFADNADSRVDRQADGSLLVGPYRYAGQGLEPLPLPHVLTRAADGTVYALDESGRAVRVRSPDGQVRRYPAQGDFPHGVRTVVLDGPRAWIVMDLGLAVIDAGTLHVLDDALPGGLATITQVTPGVPGAALPPLAP